MTVNIGDIVTMKKFRWDIGADRNWLEFKHPDKGMAFSFMFLGSEPLDGSEPVKTTEIMSGLGWGDLEKFERDFLTKVTAQFETVTDEITGSTEAKVKRVERQDDGSYTVVIDHWPQASALNLPADAIEGHVTNLLESCDALALLMDKIGNREGKLKYRRQKLKELADLLRGRSALNLPTDAPDQPYAWDCIASDGGRYLVRSNGTMPTGWDEIMPLYTALNLPADTLTRLADRLMTEIKPLDDTPPSIQSQANIRLINAVHEAVSILRCSALNRDTEAATQ